VGIGAVIALLAGCVVAPKKGLGDKDLLGVIQEKADQISAAGGMAVLGRGESSGITLALDSAKTKGCAAIEFMVEAKMDVLEKAFQAEVGEGSEYRDLFSAARKHLTRQMRPEGQGGAIEVKGVKYGTLDARTTAVALMVLDPKVIADAFAAQQKVQQAAYTRFRASQAYRTIDDDVQKYNEYKRKDMGTR
jgi:hypothetical protein